MSRDPSIFNLGFFCFFGGVESELQEGDFLSQKVNKFQVIRGKQTKGEEDQKKEGLYQ